jgi:hypothetical protein
MTKCAEQPRPTSDPFTPEHIDFNPLGIGYNPSLALPIVDSALGLSARSD